MSIAKHKVFISYYHKDDQEFKNALLDANDEYGLFEDYSVHEDEIDDTGMTDEQIRCEIRDNYIKNATVLLLLCGENTRKRKYIDWEIWVSIAWIVISLLFLISGIVSIKFAMKAYKKWKEDGCSRYDSSKDVADALLFIGIALILIFAIIASINAFDIIKCLTFPEMKIYEYITILMSNN